ncbi:MAG: multicopper oxidase family protein [Candidatus Baltobacteraceae bacterium]
MPEASLAASAKVHPHACGPAVASGDFTEPPDVEVWNLPRNASGEHELILAVHGDENRYCYRYLINGVFQEEPPTIRVRRGEHFAIRIVNDIAGKSRGEMLSSAEIPPCHPGEMPMQPAAHWVGYLNHTIDDRYMKVPPVDTNLHLHGFQGPAAQENVFVSSLSTPVHACEYHITIPYTQPPGTYMYHPHSHGSSDPEVALGLDGAWIVEPDQAQLPRSDEHVIFLRYQLPIALDNMYAPDTDPFVPVAAAHEAALPVASPVPYDPFDPPPWPMTYPMKIGGVALDPSGCNGAASEAVFQINGFVVPALLQVPAGAPQLLRILNGTSDSAAALELRDSSGHVLPMRVVGLDGAPVSGDMEHPLAHYIAMNQVMLTSMSRADVLVTVQPGQTLVLSKEHYCEGKDAFYQMHRDLLKIAAAPGAPERSVALASTPIAVADTPAAKLVAYARANPQLVHKRALTFTEYVFPKRGKTPLHEGYYITDTTNPDFQEHSYWPVFAAGEMVPANPDIVVKKGSIEEWYLINTTMESHEFHIHQMAFVQERSPAGIPLMTDTAFVPVGTPLPNKRDPNYPLVKPRITKILLDFRHVPRGTFVFHCHMLFHEDRGMMAIIKVE